MGALNFISGCISATLVFGGVATKLDKTTLTTGGIAIGMGFIYEGMGTFLKENSSAYVVAIVGGITVRLLMEIWAEEKVNWGKEKVNLENSLSRATDSLGRMLTDQLYQATEGRNAVARRAYNSGYQDGYQAAQTNQQARQSHQGILTGTAPYRGQEEVAVAH